jgi:hypothetical protein
MQVFECRNDFLFEGRDILNEGIHFLYEGF